MKKYSLYLAAAMYSLIFLASCSSAPILKISETQTIFRNEGAWLGINVKDKLPDGIEVIDIYIDSPAELAGVKVGDIIIGCDDLPVNSTGALLSFVSQRKTGDKIRVKLIRNADKVTLASNELSLEELAAKFHDFINKGNPLDKIEFDASREAKPMEVEVTLASAPKVAHLNIPAKPETKGDKKAGYMGITMEPAKELDKLGVEKGSGGLKMNSVAENSPADKGGLKTNDIIIAYDGIKFAGEADKYQGAFADYIKTKGSGYEIKLEVLRFDDEVSLKINKKNIPSKPDELMKIISQLKPGETAVASVRKNIQSLQLKVTLGTRMASNVSAPAEPEANDKIHPELTAYTISLEELTKKILDETKIRDKYDDLLKRYAEDEKSFDDGFRLRDMRYLHRDPFKITKVCDDLLADLRQEINSKEPSFLDIVISKLDESITNNPIALVQLKTGISLEEHCEQLVDLMKLADQYRKGAFSGLTQDDVKFLEENLMGLMDSWIGETNFTDTEQVKKQNDIDKRIVQLCDFVNFQKLFASTKIMTSILSQGYLNGLKKDLETAAKDKEGVLLSKDTPFGKIVISGKGDNWHISNEAIIIDLDGNDFYANNLGSSILTKHPFSIIIDFAGDDRYSSYYDGCQGAGIMGTGILIDLGGNDTYIAQKWGQGAGLLGTGILIDETGHDTYKGQEFVQGAGLFGIGILIDNHQTESDKFWYDVNASDSYESNGLGQGFGGPKGFGLLFDAYGNDTYRATAKRPNGYPDNPGSFDGWAQGCGTGFRGYADGSIYRSGGLGILMDNEGADYYEAGSFSQGGGYFFGWGILSDGGKDNDRYLGTRYAQGFAAHSAIGYFIDEGGNDHYRTQYSVVDGLSWDLTCVAFVDKGGNDTYNGGGFSLGASAHNGFCLFMDLGGKDTYDGAVAKAGGNDYHGGYSLSVFLDQGPEENTYGQRSNNSIEVEKEYSIFIDTKKPVDELLKDDAYKAILKNNIEPVSPTAQAAVNPDVVSNSSASEAKESKENDLKTAQLSNPEPISPTRPDFILTGTIIRQDVSWALIINKTTNAEDIYKVGDNIDKEWKVTEIVPSKVTLQNNHSDKIVLRISDKSMRDFDPPIPTPPTPPIPLIPLIPVESNQPPEPIFFSASVNPDNSPIAPANEFPAKTSRIYSCFENKGLLAGLSKVGTTWNSEEDTEFAEVKLLNPSAKFNYIWVSKKDKWPLGKCEVVLIHPETMLVLAKGYFKIVP